MNRQSNRNVIQNREICNEINALGGGKQLTTKRTDVQIKYIIGTLNGKVNYKYQ